MPNISRDSFDDAKNYKQVVIQVGTPFIDSEANESSKIGQVETVENTAVNLSGLRATESGELRYGYAAGDAWLCTAAGTANITVKAGTLHVDGYRMTEAADVSMTAEGLTFGAVGGSDQYGFLYVDFVIDEIDATEDTNIATPGLGETSRRYTLKATFGKAEGTTSFEATFTALTALPVISGARIWSGQPARVYLCRYLRPAGTTNITQAMLQDLRAALPGDNKIQNKFIKTIRAAGGALEGTATSDGMIVWSLDNSQLQIGVSNGAATNDALEIGLICSAQGTPDHYIAWGTTVVYATNGAGSADGSPRVPNWTPGWDIPDGSALGYLAEGGATNRRSSFLTRKVALDDSPRAAVYEYGTSTPVAYTPSQLTVQRLTVATIDSFTGDPGAFILVYRKGNDLIWYNGQVTRGIAGRAVFVELGSTPSIHDAIMGASGVGSNHITQADAVERFLLYTATGTGTGNLGSSRVVRGHVRRGAYTFARAIRKFGQAAELSTQASTYDTDNSVVELTGDGPGVTQVTFSNPLASTRAEADIGVCQIVAHKIKISGISFTQVETSTLKGSYVLDLEGFEVVLEDCHFTGPVKIKASRITVKNCHFYALGNSGYNLFPSSITGYPLTAQHLFLTPETADTCFWEISGNYFSLGTSDGTHASVIVSTPTAATAGNPGLVAQFHHNIWYGGAGIPALDLGAEGDIEIWGNRFLYSSGVTKAGALTADVVPFNGSYNGCPLKQDQATTQIVATGYISVARGRTRASKLTVRNNYFAFNRVGTTSARFVLWGAFMASFNYYTVGSTATVVYANISFLDNEVLMRSDTQWGAAAANPQMATWGFWLSPTVQDGVGITNLLVDNIQVRGNKFDLGGESTANAGYMWRSIRSMSLAAWPASGGHLTDSSAAIGIQLKNVIIGAETHTGRWANNIHISGNSISQREQSGSSGPAGYSQIAMDSTGGGAHPNWWGYCIWLDAGHQSTQGLATGAAADEQGSPYYNVDNLVATATVPGTGGVFFSPRIEGNRVEAPFFGVVTTSSADSLVGGIDVIGAYQPIVTGNQVYLAIDATTKTVGIHFLGTNRGLMASNIVTARYGIYGPAANYAADNLILANAGGAQGINGSIVATEATNSNYP